MIRRPERPVTRVEADPGSPLRADAWPMTVPCVRQLVDEGLDLGAVTVLVGENGSGKSTLVEAIAQAYGLSPEGGSTGAQHSTRPTESDLWKSLRLHRGIGSARWGYFLRAETMHGFYTYLEDVGLDGGILHGRSHGESFLDVLASRFDDPGLYVLDEPESALSFTGCLSLIGLLAEIAADPHRQAVLATHSPILAAVPGATILEVGSWGIRHSAWAELELVQNWRAFLEDPRLYLRHLGP